MTTIIVHGTFAATENWYWNSWHENGFCQSLSDAMLESSGYEDIWRVDGTYVDEVEALNPRSGFWFGKLGQISQVKGHFIWSGDYNAISRNMAAEELARYLNVLRDLTDEPIRIIAHSHGCNVVKYASVSPKLNSNVYIERAVFLACPHFYADEYSQKGLFDARLEMTGKKYLYALQPDRFGCIANMYSTRDPVVGKLADKLATPDGWEYEIPHVSFIDEDPDVTGLYENYEMVVPEQIRGSAVHAWLHSPEMARVVGSWLETGQF